MTQTLEIFISYSHEDEPFKEQLDTHLVSLKREGLVSVWHDRLISPGAVLDGAIREALERANIFLFLVSPSFIASDYCHDIEMRRALERHEAGEAEIIPIIIRPCDWTNTGLGKFLAVPTDGSPVSTFADADSAFLDIKLLVSLGNGCIWTSRYGSKGAEGGALLLLCEDLLGRSSPDYDYMLKQLKDLLTNRLLRICPVEAVWRLEDGMTSFRGVSKEHQLFHTEMLFNTEHLWFEGDGKPENAYAVVPTNMTIEFLDFLGLRTGICEHIFPDKTFVP